MADATKPTQSARTCLASRNFAGIYRASAATILVASSIDGGKSVDANQMGFVIGMEISFEVPHTVLTSLFNNSYYIVEGFPKGAAVFNRIIAPNNVKEALCTCEPKDIQLSFNSALCYTPKGSNSEMQFNSDDTITLKNAIPIQIRYQASNESIITTFSVAFTFTEIV